MLDYSMLGTFQRHVMGITAAQFFWNPEEAPEDTLLEHPSTGATKRREGEDMQDNDTAGPSSSQRA